MPWTSTSHQGVSQALPSCHVLATDQGGNKINRIPLLWIAYKARIRYALAVACQLNYQE